jgi:hypothetical protein
MILIKYENQFKKNKMKKLLPFNKSNSRKFIYNINNIIYIIDLNGNT